MAWDGQTLDGAWTTEPARADAVVDLCGLSVGTWPWTAGTRARLRSTRLEPRAALVDAIRGLDAAVRPRTLVGISGTDGYVGSDATPAGEGTPLADTFLGRLCADWEAAALPAADLGVRLVIARSAVVVAPGAPVLARLSLPVRLFVGGRIGSGRQWFSWVHIDDWVRAIRRLLDDQGLDGPVNIASPGALHQAEVARALGRVFHRPSLVPTPAVAVRLVLGGQADLVLGSRRVAPARLQAAGFDFAWTDFEAAVRDVTR
ncbi:MAG: TIGR01777 family oxidoreductase [Chloroflexota bacterium]